MYMNEGATATLAGNSTDRGYPYPGEFRLEPPRCPKVRTVDAGPRVVRSFAPRGVNCGLPEGGQRDLPSRVDEAEMSAPPGVRPEDVAAAAFDGVSDRKILAGALSGLMSSDAATRALAAKTVGCIRHELSGRALVAQLARQTSVNARAECVNALTRLEAKEGLPAVENALDDEHAAVRLAAVRGIYRLAGREGADLLVRMLHDASEDVRRRAATCLGWLDHKPAAGDLLSRLADPHAFVRGAAVDALANLGSSRLRGRSGTPRRGSVPAGTFGAAKARAVPEITELLNDPVESVCQDRRPQEPPEDYSPRPLETRLATQLLTDPVGSVC